MLNWELFLAKVPLFFKDGYFGRVQLSLLGRTDELQFGLTNRSSGNGTRS